MEKNVAADEQAPAGPPVCRLIDWFATGQGCQIEIGGVTVGLRVVGQKGRRTRIAVTAPPGATFSTPEG